jgi:hypothetical protein
MRPTTSELLAAVASALERQVAPKVDDKWAASTLRSAAQLLAYASARSEREPRILDEDNEDARALLESLSARLDEESPARREVQEALRGAAVAGSDALSRDARNERYQAAIDRLLRDPRVRALKPVYQSLRGYLRRRLRREHGLYFPVFTGPPF